MASPAMLVITSMLVVTGKFASLHASLQISATPQNYLASLYLDITRQLSWAASALLLVACSALNVQQCALQNFARMVAETDVLAEWAQQQALSHAESTDRDTDRPQDTPADAARQPGTAGPRRSNPILQALQKEHQNHSKQLQAFNSESTSLWQAVTETSK